MAAGDMFSRPIKRAAALFGLAFVLYYLLKSNDDGSAKNHHNRTRKKLLEATVETERSPASEVGYNTQASQEPEEPLAFPEKISELPEETPKPVVTNAGKTKHILYATYFFRTLDFQFGEGTEPFRTKCGRSDCFATSNSSLFGGGEASLAKFDALIFHPINMTDVDTGE